MPAGDPLELPYFSPASSDELLDAEGTGRTVVAPNGQAVEVRRQRVAVPGSSTEGTLLEVRDRLPAALDAGRLAVRTELVDVATTAAVNAVRDRLPAALEAGRLPVDVEGTATRATEATLATRATEATLATRATEATLEATRAAVDELEQNTAAVRDRLPAALEAGRLAVETELADVATETTLAARASEAKLEQVRAAVDELEATAATLRDTVHRRTDPLAAGSNNIGFTSPSTAQKTALGRFNLATSGRMTLSLSGNLRATFTNPAGSGKTISVVRIAAFTTATGWAEVRLNPTSGLPATAARPRLNGIAGGGVAGVGELRVDTSATVPLAGGVDTGVVIGLPGGQRTSIDLPPEIIAPGVVLGINVPFAGASDVVLSLYWIED